jgi:hypothetical protein
LRLQEIRDPSIWEIAANIFNPGLADLLAYLVR